MCALLPAWLCLLLGLLPLEIQCRAFTLQSLTHRHSSSGKDPMLRSNLGGMLKKLLFLSGSPQVHNLNYYAV
ncbi:ADM2-like isoform X1, partial [Lates japonicus]